MKANPPVKNKPRIALLCISIARSASVKGVSVPAKEVGGDFFNYFSLADGRIALLVGDVSGKGVGAALLMANIQASLRTRLALGQDLDAIAREIDVDIEGNTPGPIYATLFVGILDPATRELRYVLCAVGRDGEDYVFTPFGHLAPGNPYDAYIPPA